MGVNTTTPTGLLSIFGILTTVLSYAISMSILEGWFPGGGVGYLQLFTFMFIVYLKIKD